MSNLVDGLPDGFDEPDAIDCMRRCAEPLPPGACEWCGGHKLNVYGLCPHCFRFPVTNEVKP